jgi:purine nucleoside permease
MRGRYMVLRAGSNFTMPPPAWAAENMARENSGYSGMTVALEALYKTGSVVVDELLAHWDRYAKTAPGQPE